MNFYVMTLFPEMIEQGMQTSILGRAVKNGYLSLDAVNIRDYTENKHKKVDDYPYGGGAGMLMQAQPVFDCYKDVEQKIKTRRYAAHSGQEGENFQKEKALDNEKAGQRTRVVYLTPQGQTFSQKLAQEFAQEEDLIFLCGHYEGIDERVLEEIVTDYVSIGDYVLTGGELPAMVMMDAIARLVPGVLHNEVSADFETFHNDLLEYPQYSRPEEWHGKRVPEVLLCGDHKKITQWRLEQSEERTKLRRPDLYEIYSNKQEWIHRLLKKGKILYIDTIENLRRGRGEISYASNEGMIVCDKAAKLYMISVFGEENEQNKAQELVARLPKTAAGWQFIVHQKCLLDPLRKRFSIGAETPMRQTVYTEKVSLPVAKNIQFQPLGLEYMEEVMGHYHMVPDRAYIEERLRTGNIYGAFIEGELAGFAGVHQEGSLGILEVYENYRRQGIGRALEAFMINRHLSMGYTPYGEVVVDNEASLGLQKKMGLYLSKEVLYWVTTKKCEF